LANLIEIPPHQKKRKRAKQGDGNANDQGSADLFRPTSKIASRSLRVRQGRRLRSEQEKISDAVSERQRGEIIISEHGRAQAKIAGAEGRVQSNPKGANQNQTVNQMHHRLGEEHSQSSVIAKLQRMRFPADGKHED